MTTLDNSVNSVSGFRMLTRTPILDMTLGFALAALAGIIIDITATITTSLAAIVTVAALVVGLLWGTLAWSLYGTRRGGIASNALRQVSDALTLRQIKALGVVEFLLLGTMAMAIIMNVLAGGVTAFLAVMTAVMAVAGVVRFVLAQSGFLSGR